MLRFFLAWALAAGIAIAFGAAALAETGIASYYCCEHQGRRTASGERFDQHALTAAHPSLRFGTRVKVENLTTGRAVIVRVNDRGPARWTGRAIDLSLAAARRLGMVEAGLARVRITVLR